MAKARRGGGNGSGEQVEILRGIWDEMKGLKASFESQLDQTRRELRSELDQMRRELRSELAQTRSELKTEIDGLGKVMVESDVRLATAVTELATDVQRLGGLISDWREEHRADRAELRARVGRIEEHLGLPGKQ